MDKEKIIGAIKTSNFQPIVFFESEVDSTNEYAKRLLREGLDSEALIISEKQSAGRGRGDRTWHSPSGGLYMSFVLKRGNNLSLYPLFSYMLALSTSHVLEEMTSLEVDLKWPNDLLVSEKKIGGILSELVTDNPEFPVVILGIGINLNEDVASFPSALHSTATSVRSETGTQVNCELIVSGIVNALDKWFIHDSSLSSVIEEYRSKCVTLGKKVTVRLVQESFNGQAIDVTNEGSLLVRDTSGTERIISSGEVIHLRSE